MVKIMTMSEDKAHGNASADPSTSDEVAWKVAIALALALPKPPGWARWAAGWTAADTHREELRARIERESIAAGASETWAAREASHAARDARIEPVPVPAPWDVDAYLADCELRKVDPGPPPSLSWTEPDGFGWEVKMFDGLSLYVEFWWDFAWDGQTVASWMPAPDVLAWNIADPEVPRDVVARIVECATAAKRAMERRSSQSNEEG